MVFRGAAKGAVASAVLKGGSAEHSVTREVLIDTTPVCDVIAWLRNMRDLPAFQVEQSRLAGA